MAKRCRKEDDVELPPASSWPDSTRIKYAPNAKKAGTASYTRYQKYSKARTVGDALKLGSSRSDLAWDHSRGHLRAFGKVKIEDGSARPAKRLCLSPMPTASKDADGFRSVARPALATALRDGVRLGSRKDGVVLPAVGYGTYKLKKNEAVDPVLAALKAGYRLLDTAQVYENEGDIGIALRKSGLPREDVCIETKVWRSSHGYQRTMDACKQSLKKLGLDYIDLYVIHWPGCKTGWPLPKGTMCPKDWTPAMRDKGTWRAMEQLYDEGKVKAIGVTNYSLRHLKLLLKSCRIKPMVNQVEFHPRLVQTEMLEFCKKHGIAVQAYASLGSGDAGQAEDFFEFPPVKAAAKAHRVTPAQVLLRWALEKGCHIIPKSTKIERMKENAKVFGFKLTSAEVRAIDKLHTGQRFAWKGLDPDTVK